MSKRWLVLVLAITISTGFVLARGGAAATKHAARAKVATTWAPEDLKWEDMPGVPDVKVAMLWGNMSKPGGYGAFVKLPANQPHPLHTHTATLKCVIISGEFMYGPEGGPEKSYGPGSYVMVPGGLRHSSASGASELLMFQESVGAWDMKPVAAK
jgi:quercetin dioxygenase-like cupin family protein